jgi:hypothetical protein
MYYRSTIFAGHAVKFVATAVILGGIALSPAFAVPFYADNLVDSMFVTSFGSGLVTGPPDGGGLFLGDDFDPPTNPGFITVEFLTPAGDGAGFDLEILDVASSMNETANVFASSNGVAFTFVQAINAVNNDVELNGVFPGPVKFLKIANSSTTVSIDIDAVRAFYEYVPEPATAVLALVGLLGIAATRRSPR